ncbi:cubilin-like [Lineus longissimus]|uniref:cubilin-like n=1 Tax=Lineus longissimus TaxID=88925 RepID=UPI00315DB9E2
MNALKDRITVLENKPDPTYPPRPPTTASSNNANRKLKRRISALETKVSNLWNKLSSNECQNQPCQNGGTCVDLYNGYICQCPDAWEGKTCNTDVNECARFAGTDLGCQNGATCRNTRGGYTCTCTADWFGVHCTTRHDDCSGASQMELCGHGTCVDIDRTHSGQARYKCSCDEGWTTEGSAPACTKDVDECSLTNPPCSQSPHVICINLPGTYHCGPCPPGYSGNGWDCTDVDECATDNGGCSQTPLVHCINTRGSNKCGPCPPGYAGNGQTCMWQGRCSTNNGGCHRLARCIETVGVLGVRCQCPDGYYGSGVGRRSCRQPATSAPDPCSTNPCVNGRCRASGSAYTCECDTGFSGSRCQLNTDNCASSPCQNGGTCLDALNSFTCQCPDTHTGTLCETARENCGGELTTDTGSIKYPQETGVNYPHSIMCGWKIVVSSGKIVQLTFTKFNTEATSSCKFDFLAIHDGRSRGDHKIDQYCGEDLPAGGVVNTTHNAAFLYFQSDASVARDGFELTWQAQDPVCGSDLTGKDHGTISSPGYPGAYPPRIDCVWTISVSPGKKIMFHFATLDLEHHNNCTYDFLEIHDGLRETDPLLRRFCSEADPPPLTTMSPYAWIKFHSDSSENGQGFHITYSAIEVKAGSEQCGEALTDSTGAITSPNYPGNYQASINCVWTITVPDGEKIVLTLTNMDLEAATSNGDCTMDYLEIREGTDENGDLVGTYCGDRIPAVRTLTSNTVWVKFVTDESAQRTGFRLTWDIACGGAFSDEAGSITSPYYPNNYPHNKECEYVLINPTGGQVTIKFDEFAIEQVGDDCEYDYLEVRDGRTKDAGLLHKLCGSETPNPISSNGRALHLRFVSDGSTNNKGFKLSYEMNTQTCGGALTAISGVIQSPGFPNVYPHGIACVWTIDVDPGYIIRLTFHSFSTEKTANCRYDYVGVYDNSSYTDTGGLLGR